MTKLVIDFDRIKVEELDQFINTDGATSTGKVVLAQLWRFVSDDQDKALPEAEAKAFVGSLGVASALRYVAQVSKEVTDLLAEAFPPDQSPT